MTHIFSFGLETIDDRTGIPELARKYGGGARARLSDQEITNGLRHDCMDIQGSILIVDARIFVNPERDAETAGHIGTHPAIMEGVVESDRFARWIQTIKARWRAHVRACGRIINIAISCRSGRHRSVAVSTLTQSIFKAEGYSTSITHLCRNKWEGCRGDNDVRYHRPCFYRCGRKDERADICRRAYLKWCGTTPDPRSRSSTTNRWPSWHSLVDNRRPAEPKQSTDPLVNCERKAQERMTNESREIERDEIRVGAGYAPKNTRRARAVAPSKPNASPSSSSTGPWIVSPSVAHETAIPPPPNGPPPAPTQLLAPADAAKAGASRAHVQVKTPPNIIATDTMANAKQSKAPPPPAPQPPATLADKIPLLRTNVRAAIWQPAQRPGPLLPMDLKDLQIRGDPLYYQLMVWEEKLEMEENDCAPAVRKIQAIEEIIVGVDMGNQADSLHIMSKGRISLQLATHLQGELYRMVKEELERLKNKVQFFKSKSEMEQFNAAASTQGTRSDGPEGMTTFTVVGSARIMGAHAAANASKVMRSSPPQTQPC